MAIVQYVCLCVLAYTLVYDFVAKGFKPWDTIKLVSFILIVKGFSTN